MNCTGVAKRERICREYNIEVVGCFKLFDGRTVISDAGGKIITDKYYLFKCIHKTRSIEQTIKCGSAVARHICELSKNTMPTEFNPFAELHAGGEGVGGGHARTHWHRSRRQLYNAIMLFITRYGDRLKPDTPIYAVKKRVESNVVAPAEERDILAINTILGTFHTTMTDILDDFARTRAVRVFNFDLLIQILEDRGIEISNFN